MGLYRDLCILLYLSMTVYSLFHLSLGSVYCRGSPFWVHVFLTPIWKKDVGSNGVICPFMQAIMHHEGHMDDGLNLSRSQHEESRTARVIRSTVFLFNRFIRYIFLLCCDCLIFYFNFVFRLQINNSKTYYVGKSQTVWQFCWTH